MTKRRLAVPLGVLLVIAGVLWFRFAPGDVPPGQPPLVALDEASLDALKADFNRDANQTRVIVLLSPT